MSLVEQKTSRFVQAGALRLHYNEAGEGPPVICLHGGGPGASSWSNYSRNVDFLAKHFRILLLDLPGYGQSDKPRIEGPLYAYLGNAVRDFVDALKIPKAHFLGNSLGGGTSLSVATLHPTRVDRLVLMGPAGGLPIFSASPTEGIRRLRNFYEPPGPSLDAFRSFLEYMVYDKATLTDELVEQRYAAAIREGIAENFPLRSSNVSSRPAEALWMKLSSIKQKTLVVWGREDRTNTLDQSFIILNQIPDVRLHVFSQCGHWAQWEKADEFNRLVVDFLREPDV